MRYAAMNLRACHEQRDLIDRAAKLLGRSRSDFMLEAACEKAQSVLLDQVFFSLDAETFRQFTNLSAARRSRLSRTQSLVDPDTQSVRDGQKH